MADPVLIHNPRTGQVRRVGPAAVPFFTNQGYEPLPLEPGPADEPRGRHEAPDDADPGASTTPTPAPISLIKEN